MPAPSSLTQITGWRSLVSVDGNSTTTSVWTCDLSEIAASRLYLLASAAADSYDVTGLLKCMSVEVRYGTGNSDDPAGGKAILTANYVPAWKVDSYSTAQAFKIRYAWGSESFTFGVKGPKAIWSDGKPILNRSILPLKTLATCDITLFGVRTAGDLTTYASYANKVNSDTFLGASAGLVIFSGATMTPMQLSDGTNADRHEVNLKWREIEWNKDYREEDGTWATPWPDGANPKFASTALAGLYATPSP